ncbi:transcriptional repressor [Leptobacterium flavescens]|uniref:Transcriptional repressor n=1 Tax=Leptobacterium flavescens TaxID=472055 RepID=A0A6P0ULA1_9FLAO|nr:transcriptional repressor [Leptobacterium flavescens]NER11833.1 transcriptional repressor [Leptobacterium flavescens]
MEEIEEILEERGVRPTTMRLLIYKFLSEKRVALSLKDLENKFDRSDRTTLFRTLKTFEDKGIVHQIDDGSGVNKYAVCALECNCEIENDLHLHFHCNTCNETTCLTDHKIPQISLPAGYSAENVNLVVKGVCEKCS